MKLTIIFPSTLFFVFSLSIFAADHQDAVKGKLLIGTTGQVDDAITIDITPGGDITADVANLATIVCSKEWRGKFHTIESLHCCGIIRGSYCADLSKCGSSPNPKGVIGGDRVDEKAEEFIKAIAFALKVSGRFVVNYCDGARFSPAVVAEFKKYGLRVSSEYHGPAKRTLKILSESFDLAGGELRIEPEIIYMKPTINGLTFIFTGNDDEKRIVEVDDLISLEQDREKILEAIKKVMQAHPSFARENTVPLANVHPTIVSLLKKYLPVKRQIVFTKIRL